MLLLFEVRINNINNGIISNQLIALACDWAQKLLYIPDVKEHNPMALGIVTAAHILYVHIELLG